MSSIFNFDIPAAGTGNTCSLVFLLPEKNELTTSYYNISGSGQVDFSMLSGVAVQGTSASNALAVKTAAPAVSRVVSNFLCPSGEAVSDEMKSVGGTDFE